MKLDTNAKAEVLRALHSSFILLPNAWDVVSARIFERAGFGAIATTSAGIAFSLGYPDGEKIPREEMLAVVARIASRVDVPVTADVEAGYGDAAETARGVWEAGAVGMNLEDYDAAGLHEIADQVSMIRAIRAATPHMVLNARTDIYLAEIGDAATRFDRTVERLNAYLAAGADSTFVPGLRDRETIGRLTKEVGGPVNILATVGAPSIGDMKALGVRRVSVGSGPMRATLGLLDRIARELHDQGTYTAMLVGAIPYGDVNGLLAR